MDRFLNNLTLMYVPVLCAAILKEYGYFYVIGFELISKLTISDYISGFILSGPLIIAWIFGGLWGVRFPVEGDTKDTAPPSIASVRDLVFDLIIFGAFFVPMIILIGMTSAIYTFSSAIIAFLSIVIFIIMRIRLRIISYIPSLAEYMLKLIVVPLAIFIFAYGLYTADTDMRSKSFVAKVNGDDNYYYFMRSISEGSFLRSQDGIVYFYPADSIDFIHQSRSPCESFGFWRNRTVWRRVGDYFWGLSDCLPKST